MADEIELADDGSPLGTLLVDGKVYDPSGAAAPADPPAEPTKEEEAKWALEDLTGDEVDGAEVMQLYEGYSDPALRRQALALYVRDGLTTVEVARAVGVPEGTVEMWAYNGKWNRMAGRSLAIKAQEEARGLAALRMRVRRSIIESQLEASKKVRDRVLRDIEEMSAKSAADALKAAADVEARALGMSEAGAIDTMDREMDGARRDGKVPLVLVVNGGSAAGILPVRVHGEGGPA